MVANDPFIGQRIEKCQVLRPLSRGGYGTTYLAYDAELQAQRVIKVSHEPATADPGASRLLKAFLEEGLILSRLKHPQIVTLRAQGEFQTRRYMILDFVEGFSLREAFERVDRLRDHSGMPWSKWLDPATACALVLSTLEPLSYAHEAKVRLPGREVNGVAHRDIAPGNLILGVQGDERGKVVLIDFGTAKTDLADMVTMNQSLIGTLPYMSKPRLQRAQSQEQASAQQSFWSDYVETRNDVHALGVLFAQMLLGKLPFRGESAPEILVSILDQANYKALYEEVGKVFPPALPLLQNMVVWYDVAQPLKTQQAQYPDAVSLRPVFQEFFAQTFPGAQPNELLQEFHQRLQDSELFQETTTVVTRRGQPTQSLGKPIPPPPASIHVQYSPEPLGSVVQESPAPRYESTPKTLKFEWVPPAPIRRWPWIAMTVAMFAASVTIAFLLRPNRSAEGSAKSSWMAYLEPIGISQQTRVEATPLEPGLADSSNPRSPSLKDEGKKPSPTKRTKESFSRKKEAATSPSEPAVPFEPGSMAETNPILTPPLGSDLAHLPPLDRDTFLGLQNRLRQGDTAGFRQLKAYREKEPQSADLGYLLVRWKMDHSPVNTTIRDLLTGLRQASPQFLDGRLYKENVAYWLWQVNLKLFQSDPKEENRIALIQASHSYLAAYSQNSAYAAKIASIQASLP
jgi:serine/threonine protein kinase